VVFDHLTYSVFQPVRDSVYHRFDPGQYSVFVFFLVSGYIVPASLERRGSVRGFWVSRVFRLYPVYLFALSAMIVLWASGIGSLSGMDSDAVTSSFADVFMLQSVLWAPTVPNVVWSLAYEMVRADGAVPGRGVRHGPAGVLRADPPVYRGTHAAPGPEGLGAARRQVRPGHAPAAAPAPHPVRRTRRRRWADRRPARRWPGSRHCGPGRRARSPPLTSPLTAADLAAHLAIVLAAPCRRGGLAGIQADFSHSGTARTRSYGVDVPAMSLELPGWDIHAVSAGRAGAISLRRLLLPAYVAMWIHLYPQR
jgi:Acyltransferase family